MLPTTSITAFPWSLAMTTYPVGVEREDFAAAPHREEALKRPDWKPRGPAAPEA